MESDADFAEKARAMGWKLSNYMTPEVTMAYNYADGCWYLLDENTRRRAVA
jgi:hypothetical protein